MHKCSYIWNLAQPTSLTSENTAKNKFCLSNNHKLCFGSGGWTLTSELTDLLTCCGAVSLQWVVTRDQTADTGLTLSWNSLVVTNTLQHSAAVTVQGTVQNCVCQQLFAIWFHYHLHELLKVGNVRRIPGQGFWCRNNFSMHTLARPECSFEGSRSKDAWPSLSMFSFLRSLLCSQHFPLPDVVLPLSGLRWKEMKEKGWSSWFGGFQGKQIDRSGGGLIRVHELKKSLSWGL